MGTQADTSIDYRDWVGRSETMTDTVDPFRIKALAATLGTDIGSARQGEAWVPPLWAWLSFLPVVPMSEVGPDGHPARGGFLPPIALERRMWAGGRLSFQAPFQLGDTLERTSTILSVDPKESRAGPLVLLTVGHEIKRAGEVCITEEQDIVYVAIPETFKPPPAKQVPEGDWTDTVPIDPVFLFRFSALTFNGHRIHYDRPYAMEREKYPGLVVHGPLQALLLFEAGRRRQRDRALAGFEFRAMRPLFDFDQVTLTGLQTEGHSIDLYTANGEGAIGMKACLTFRS
ncbi:MAG: MaoC family dehydratase N-terminal domain-containing protein [Pseudomonadota bacterium]